ncbi:MAG: acylphosphatase [Rhodosalinus sp.]|uniref:acylphosphatase n=1 Tax=Rhodosalinus sp. TaxID=2047741 RepID=UPI00397DEF72
MIPGAVSVRVTGRVQGVSFRAWTEAEARRLGLAGWVRNAPDGSVEARLQGDPEAVRQMLRRLWDGPSAAHVTGVDSSPTATEPGLSGFEIRR